MAICLGKWLLLLNQQCEVGPASGLRQGALGGGGEAVGRPLLGPAVPFIPDLTFFYVKVYLQPLTESGNTGQE